MRRFVLLKTCAYGEQAKQLAIAIQARLDGEPAYLGRWEWVSTTKDMNGQKVPGPILLANGGRDVLAYRDYVAGGKGDVYCHPELRDWVLGGMQGDPPRPLERLPENLIIQSV